MSAPLYTIDVLRLAASIPHQARLANPMATSEKRSAVCGSRVTVDVDVVEGRVAELGLAVHACALGQASASLMAAHAIGRTPGELAEVRDALAAWLAGAGDAPRWPGLDIFAAALPHHARHAAIRLAFDAVAEASAAAETPALRRAG